MIRNHQGENERYLRDLAKLLTHEKDGDKIIEWTKNKIDLYKIYERTLDYDYKQ